MYFKAYVAFPLILLSFVNNLNLGIVLDLQKSCQYSTEFLYTLHPVSSNVNILYNHGTFVKTKNSTLCITVNQTTGVIWILPLSYEHPFLFQDPSHVALSSPPSLDCDSFSIFSCLHDFDHFEYRVSIL